MRGWPIARVAILLLVAVLVFPWMTAAEERAAAETKDEKEQAPQLTATSMRFPVRVAGDGQLRRTMTIDMAAASSQKTSKVTSATASEIASESASKSAPEAASGMEPTSLAASESDASMEAVNGMGALRALQPAESAMEPMEVYQQLAAGVRMDEGRAMDGTGDMEREIPAEPTVYLTFDDGPSRLTPEVLDILHEHEVPATFFVLGQSAEIHVDMIRRIVDEGHAIGNHTFNHKYQELYTRFEDFWKQVEHTDQILYRLTGQQVRLFRAPGGTYTNFDAFYFYYMEHAGYRVHDWTVDAGDSKRRGVPTEEIIRNIKQAKLTHEVNVLLHDSAGHEATVKALPEIISYYKEQGYRFAVLSENVKPVTFRIGPLKWRRDWSEEAHRAALELIQQTDTLRHQSMVAQAEASSARQALAVEDQESVDMQEWLPLREWAYAQGAAVQWDAQAKIAKLYVGDERIELRTASGTLSWEEQGQPRSRMQVAYRFEHDRLYVKRQEVEQWQAMKEPRSFVYQSAGRSE